MTEKAIIHLLSGGLDSVTMLHELKSKGHLIHCLLVDYGQKHKQELVWAKGHARRLGCESVDGTGWFRDPSRKDKLPFIESFIEGYRKPQMELPL